MLKDIALKIKGAGGRFFQQPVSFVFRQIYRIAVVLPFQGVVWIMGFFTNLQPKSNQARVGYCFMITSVIYPKASKIQYDSPRSVFSPDERALQTLTTIKSVRERAPGAKIILIEAGLQKELPYGLATAVDQYIYVGEKKLARWACDSRYKSLGEIMMVLTAFKRFAFWAEFYFKLSGRYYLNDEFVLANWRKALFELQYIKDDYVSTRLYGFAHAGIGIWKQALRKSIPLALISYAIENTLAKFLPREKVRHMAVLGVSGVGGADKAPIKD